MADVELARSRAGCPASTHQPVFSHVNLCSDSPFLSAEQRLVTSMCGCCAFSAGKASLFSHQSPGSLDTQHPISFLSYCLSGLLAGLHHQMKPNLFLGSGKRGYFCCIRGKFLTWPSNPKQHSCSGESVPSIHAALQTRSSPARSKAASG